MHNIVPIWGVPVREYEDYLLSRGRQPSTIRQRVLQVERLAQKVPIFHATENDLRRVLASMHRKSANYRHSTIAGWRSFYRWAHRNGFIAVDPTAELEQISVPVRVPRIAPDDAVLAAVDGASTRDRTMILLARLACLRLSELTMLQTTDRERDYLRIIGKGDKERIVYINDELEETLDEREREVGSGFYLPGGTSVGSMHPMSVNKIITRRTGYNPHSLRHAGATAAYRATRNLRAVQKMLGHASLATTQRYLHLDDEELRDASRGTAFVERRAA